MKTANQIDEKLKTQFLDKEKGTKITLAESDNIDKLHRQSDDSGTLKMSVLTKGKNLKRQKDGAETKETFEGLLLTSASSVKEDERELNFSFNQAQFGNEKIMKFFLGGTSEPSKTKQRLAETLECSKHNDPFTYYHVFTCHVTKDEVFKIQGKDIIDEIAAQKDKSWERVALENWGLRGIVSLGHDYEVDIEEDLRRRACHLAYTSLELSRGQGVMTEAVATGVNDLLPMFKASKAKMYIPADKNSKHPYDQTDQYDLFNGDVVATAREDNPASWHLLKKVGMKIVPEKSGFLYDQPDFRYYFKKKT